MNVGAMLQSAIYVISSSMLYPAMLILVGGFAAVVVSGGAAMSEWASRRTGKNSPPETRARNSRAAMNGLEAVLQKPGATWDDVEFFWRGARMAMWKKLDYLRILARLGPAMGLVGTLIPMSTGLASLTQGDTSRLSSDLVVAFSTTVVGLCFGVAAYVLYTVKSRWLEEDLQALRLVIEARAAETLDAAAGEEPR